MTTVLRTTALMILLALAAPGGANEGTLAMPTTNLLFIHHSCGGTLMADAGERVGGQKGSGERCIYQQHPNGGGLRAQLEAAGFTVNEASYESVVGEDTDFCHWHAKFRDHMDRILTTQRQDTRLPEGQTNQVVVFKSCYSSARFESRGQEPGDPDDCTQTVANAKAAYRAILPYLAEHPQVLFIAMTAPPLAKPIPVGFTAKVKALFQGTPKWADHQREFSTWLADPQAGWLAEYQGHNVAVFDYYDILTDHGRTNWSAYPSGDGQDSHPNRTGNTQAATAFLPFLTQTLATFQSAAVQP